MPNSTKSRLERPVPRQLQRLVGRLVPRPDARDREWRGDDQSPRIAELVPRSVEFKLDKRTDIGGAMNWEAIGAVGEVVGATAVILTLLYVGVQIKQNTAASRAQAINQVNSQYGALMSQIALNGELARICRIAAEGGELDPDEGTRYRAYLSAFFAFIEENYLLQKAGTYTEDLGDTEDIVEFLSPTIVRLLKCPVAIQWWKDESRNIYLAEVCDRVDQVTGLSARESPTNPNVGDS